MRKGNIDNTDRDDTDREEASKGTLKEKANVLKVCSLNNLTYRK